MMRLKLTPLAGLTLACLLSLGASLPATARALYEPGGAELVPPNAVLAASTGTEVPAQAAPGGAELVESDPRFANAVVTMGRNGKIEADVYVGFQRVMAIKGDDGTRAEGIASAINRAHARGLLRADRIVPGRAGGQYAIMAGREPLIRIDDKLAAAQGVRPAGLTIRWLDNLRAAMGGVPFAQTASRGGFMVSGSRVGHASWYGPGFHGRRAASGERFDQNALTAAHKTLPFGTLLLVTNLRNSRSVLVRINDRGPYIPGRMLDLSAAAARSIGMSGVGSVRIDVLRR